MGLNQALVVRLVFWVTCAKITDMTKNSPVLKLALFIGLVTMTLSVPVIHFFSFTFTPLHNNTNPEPSQYLEIHKGDHPISITQELIKLRVIEDQKNFLLLGKVTRLWGKIKAGEYEVSAQMSPYQVLSQITSGISVVHPVTIKEGENIYEIAKDLASKNLIKSEGEFINLARDEKFIQSLTAFKGHPTRTLEGYFFPETYFFNKTQSPQDIAKQMLSHFFQYWSELKASRAQELGMNLHQVVTLASMIEKETGAAEERPLISSVFHNRLKQGMRLQSDPTTIYGMWNRYQGNIHKSDLLEKNDYNTYQIAGLPIGPISNPGRASLDAALYPLQTTYLYFVSQNDGTHRFSENYADHLKAVQKFQINPKTTQVKGWRNLDKKSTTSQ